MSNLVFNLNDLKGLTVGEVSGAFGKWVWSRPGRSIGHWGTMLSRITIEDLATHNLGMPSNGLYVFYDAWGVVPTVRYVGKCTSRSFLERIPAHLESRHECWFNTLTKRAHENLPPGEDGAAPSLENASEHCLKSLSVALIPIDCGVKDPLIASQVGLLERRLRDPKGLAPTWNTNRRGKQCTGDEPLVDDLFWAVSSPEPVPLEPAKPAI